MEFVNKNDKQLYFNQIRGVIEEINDDANYCSVTIKVGHENKRDVNLSIKKAQFDAIKHKLSLGDKISVRYYITSRKKNERWYTTANVLEILQNQ